MQEQLKKLLEKVLEWWKKFNNKQRVLILSSIGVVIIALVILAFAIFAWRLQRMQRQMHEQFRQQGEKSGHQQYSYRSRRQTTNEGDVSIHATQAMPEKRISDDVGEYVDFKEVADEEHNK